MASRGGPNVEVYIAPGSIERIHEDLSRFRPALAASLERGVRKTGEDALREVRGKLAEAPPTGGGESIGSRASIADSAKVTNDGPLSMKIEVDDIRNGFSAAYNKSSWRHPVYGRGEVEQKGRPYFGEDITPSLRSGEIEKMMEKSLDEAIIAIGGI